MMRQPLKYKKVIGNTPKKILMLNTLMPVKRHLKLRISLSLRAKRKHLLRHVQLKWSKPLKRRTIRNTIKNQNTMCLEMITRCLLKYQHSSNLSLFFSLQTFKLLSILHYVHIQATYTDNRLTRMHKNKEKKVPSFVCMYV